MATQAENQVLLDQLAAFRKELVADLAAHLRERPSIGEQMDREVDAQERLLVTEAAQRPRPPDLGLAELIGVGPDAAESLGETRLPHEVPVYDETIASERIAALADLYYLYQHETIGVFRAIRKLQELFRAGSVRLSSGAGAYGLYRYDRREVLRYTRRDRLAAYRRAFGYGTASAPGGARANLEFHPLFVQFNNQVASYWRDKRVSDVIRERANDPSFGSIAVVRRAGLDLRNNLKFTSYGHVNVLRVEVMQLLEEAFDILGADDVRRLFGADNAWDVVEEILARYFDKRLETSPRQRMAVTGRQVLRWLAQAHVLEQGRSEFEALLLEVAESAEEWLTSAQALGLARRSALRELRPHTRTSRTDMTRNGHRPTL